MPMLVRSKEAHVVHSAAGLPVDEVTRAELVGYGEKVLRSENIRQTVRGAATKRNGFSSLPNTRTDATTATAAYKMFADRQSIVRVTDTLQAEVYSSKAAAWSALGRVPEATARIIDLPSMGITTYLEDVDATNGYIAISWASIATGTGVNCYLSVIDQATGAVLRAPEKISAGTDPVPGLLGVQGNYFVMVRYNSAGTKIEAWALDTTSAATIALGWVAFGASLATDASGGYVVHSLPHAITPLIAILYSNTSGGTDRITLKTFSVAGGVSQTKTILTNSITPTTFALCGLVTDTIWLVWNEAAVIAVRGVQPFSITVDNATVGYLGAMTTGCNYLGIAPSTTAGKARWWANDTAAVSQSKMMGVKTTAGAAAADGAQITIPAVKMVRKPFFLAGRYYSAFFNVDNVNGQSNFFVCDWTDDTSTLRPVANAAPSLASAGLAGQGKFVASVSGATTTLVVGFGLKRSAIADGSALLELDFANGKRWQTAAHANSTFLAAAIPSCFDGLRVAEIGFLYRPPKPTTALSAGPGVAAGTYRYIAVYEETDSDGNWHVSGLSDPSASVAPANQTVTVTSSPLAITSRLTSTGSAARGVRVAWYRTLTGAVAPYYRLATTINDPASTTVTYADTTLDATLALASKLYAQPGVLGTNQDRRPPPFFTSVVSYNGVLVGASGSDLWYSGQNVGGEGTWFSPIFQIPIPGDGDITALATLDGALLIFKRREVYLIAGEPPSDNGTSGGLGPPRRLACDVGCIDLRSTCTTALGVFFQSERGIEILTRAQTVEWIGEPYSVTAGAFPICTSATVEPRSNCVLVELAASESVGAVAGSGRTLVYDLSLKCWVTTDRRTSYAIVDAPSQSACMVYTGSAYRYAWLSGTGVVYTENDTHLDADNNYWVTSLIETASAKHGLQQEQIIWAGAVLYERAGAAGLKIEVASDYAAYSSANDKVWTEAEVLSGARQLPYAPVLESQGMRFRISDTAPAVLGTGAGLTFIGLSLDTAPRQGTSHGLPQLDPALRK